MFAASHPNAPPKLAWISREQYFCRYCEDYKINLSPWMTCMPHFIRWVYKYDLVGAYFAITRLKKEIKWKEYWGVLQSACHHSSVAASLNHAYTLTAAKQVEQPENCLKFMWSSFKLVICMQKRCCIIMWAKIVISSPCPDMVISY